MSEDFMKYISCSIKSIEHKDFETAKNYIQKSILQSIGAPQPFNLLGILEEYKGNLSQACKYYRASYALDPTYRAASNNLERVTGTQYMKKREHVDFGNRIDEDQDESEYYVEYDLNRVGHIKRVKKGM
ncbi:MAG: hypothetical protein K0S71_2885 [Clostridia bacterium]|jgi:lipoprotein NlpI|nr:hypothetical protein [Clostridia bacterium]